MDRQIIEISNNGFFLSLYRGFLVIENEKKQKQEIPLDNILSLILSADNTVISKNIVNAVIEQGGNIIFCDKKYLPSTITGLIYTENCFITKPLSSNKLRNLVALRISVLVRTGMSNIQIIHIIDHPVRVSSRCLRAIPESLMFLFDFAEWCQFNFTCFVVCKIT